LTGTAAWNFYAISQHILGIKPQYDGLLIEPCVPETLGNFAVNRIFRDKKLEIKIINQFKTGKVRITLNGKPLQGNLIPLELMQDNNQVIVELN
jgi:cellobiose phosphorylase